MRSDGATFSSASSTRALPSARARAYAGSRRISSRLTFSDRMSAPASRRNGYFARVASSIANAGTPRSHKRPWRGVAKVAHARCARALIPPLLAPSLTQRFLSFPRLFGLGGARWRRHDAELLHHPGDVPLAPVLDALPFLESRDVDARDRHGLPRRRDAHELRLVRPRHRPAHDHLVALGDDVVDRRLAVRKRGTQHREPLLLALSARRHPGRRRVIYVVLGRHLVNHAEIPSI